MRLLPHFHLYKLDWYETISGYCVKLTVSIIHVVSTGKVTPAEIKEGFFTFHSMSDIVWRVLSKLASKPVFLLNLNVFIVSFAFQNQLKTLSPSSRSFCKTKGKRCLWAFSSQWCVFMPDSVYMLFSSVAFLF